jgi:hypothetical protein
MAKKTVYKIDADNKEYLKSIKAAGDDLIKAASKGKGTAKVAGPGGPTAKLKQSIDIGYGFDIDAIEFMATDQAYFQIAAQLTLAIRPAFRKAVEQLRKIIPEMIREQLDNSRVIQDLKNQESDLVAALGLRDSVTSADALVNHIVKSVRVRVTTSSAMTGAGEFPVPQIIWGIAQDKLESVGGWGTYTSHPSSDSINWAAWLLANSYRSSGRHIKFGSFSGRQSRTRRAIMIPGGSFSLNKYIDPYDVNFVEEIVDEDMAVKVDRIAEKIIRTEMAKIPGGSIESTAQLLKLHAGKGVNVGEGATERKTEIEERTRAQEQVESARGISEEMTADVIEKAKEAYQAGLLSEEDFMRYMRNEIDLADLGLNL